MSWLRLMEESIQENESSASEQITEAVTAAPPLKKHRFSKLLKDMWPAYIMEIIVIIIGISITLALEEWRDNNKEAKLEKIYTGNLQTDIATDQQSLIFAASETKKIIEKGEQLIGLIKTGTPPSQQVNSAVKAILGRPKFLASDATFSDLRSSGNLHLVKDIALKNLLFSYYSSVQNIKEVQEAEQQATITISGPYFLKQFSLDESDTGSIATSSVPGNLVNSIEFRNNVLLRVTNRKELMNLYQTTEKMADQLEKKLKENQEK